MRVFLTAPHIDAHLVGEPYVAFRWAQALCPLVDLTVFAFESISPESLAEQLPRARVITARMNDRWRAFPRFTAMAKPFYPAFMGHVRRVLAAEGGAAAFDIAHQIMPQAMRYPSPLRGQGIPYVLGPLGGALETPEGFRHETLSARWYTRLRALDGLRLRHDPALRASYREAALVLGVAPYVGARLAPLGLTAYADLLELGIDDLPPARGPRAPGPLRLLHVGRGVRTKGLRDAVRALASLSDLDVHLTSAGEGEEIGLCRAEAARLGVAERVTFLGQRPRAEIEDLYRAADIFVFPSFREPAGNVLYEAMRWGLPVIAADRGGPAHIVDETSGIRLPVTTPQALARDLAEAIRRLHDAPDLRRRMGEAGRARLAREALWPDKAARLVDHYRAVLARGAGAPE